LIGNFIVSRLREERRRQFGGGITIMTGER
jgi:hypothetical protein